MHLKTGRTVVLKVQPSATTWAPTDAAAYDENSDSSAELTHSVRVAKVASLTHLNIFEDVAFLPRVINRIKERINKNDRNSHKTWCISYV